MYIEDILGVLAIRLQANPGDSKFVDSFYDQICKGSGLTEKQSVIALRIISKYVDKINIITKTDILPFIITPTYRLGIRTLTTVRHISVINAAEEKKLIKVQFPYDDALLQEIKKEMKNFIQAEWVSDDKSWVFSLEDRAIGFFSNWLTGKNFTADAEFNNYVEQASLITANFENYVPMLTFEDKTAKLVNAFHGIPTLTSDTIVTALFEARRAGITIWDSNVDTAITESTVNDVTKQFIKTDPSEPFSVNLEENSIQDLKIILENLSPCIVMVPGGNELSKLESAMTLIKDTDIKNSEISVLFRLPKETGSDFNQYVRDNSLNSPITDTTKVIFLSGKIPKTLIESKIKINCIINYNFYNIHYTLANFLKNHHNVINVISNKKQKKIDDVFL
jgi:hypothetical protein